MFTYDIKSLPFISMTGRSRENPGWSHSGRIMEINLLVVLHKGECVFKINETEHHIKAGSAVIVPKDTYYRPHTDTFCEYTFFHFDGDLCPCSDVSGLTVQNTDEWSRQSMYGYSEQVSTNLVLDYIMDISECEILPNGDRVYHTLFRFHITKNEIVNGKFVTEGYFEQPEIMSDNLKRKLLQFGVPQEELNKFLKKGADYE